jgi:hypothetical protein
MANLLVSIPIEFWNYFIKYLQSLGFYFKTFSETLTADDPGWQGYCLVQRIEAVRLSSSGARVKLTLRASSGSSASIQQIYISRADPGGDPYDSAADLTPVILQTLPITPLVIPAAKTVTLEVFYNLDEKEALLIAVDFSAAPSSGIRCTKAVPPEQACAYYKEGSGTATPNRTGFTTYPGIYLIEKIEVSSGVITVTPGG